MKTYPVLSIDAWHNGDGWEWNQWYNCGQIKIDLDSDNRTILKAMRDGGGLSDNSKGKVTVEDDQYNLVILDRATREPLFAIEYGSQI